MRTRPSARERILDAAEMVVLRQGGGHMTMDAVAATAGVSKGGLIYHFPNLRSMLEAMLERFSNRVAARIAEATASLPAGPAGVVKAHILTLFALGENDRRAAQAILAATAREPELLLAARARRRAVMERLMRCVPTPERVTILILATEGLWMSDLLGVCTRNQAERQAIKQSLLCLADEWCGADGKTAGRGRAPGRRKGGAR